MDCRNRAFEGEAAGCTLAYVKLASLVFNFNIQGRMRKQSGFNIIFIATLVGGATLLASSVASAAITQQCGYCHTMHNSQDGGTFFSPVDLAPPDDPPGSSLNGALLRWDCLGCHSGFNTAASIAAGAGVPKVNATAGEPAYDNSDAGSGAANGTLAGGDFYYVTLDDTFGHNVDVVDADGDGTLTTPPGWDNGLGTGINLNGPTWSEPVRCAGTYGCHGDHSQADAFAAISGAHHGDDGTVDGTTIGKSYRWLDGILGTEDVDWEWTRGDNSTDHNQYRGVDRHKGVDTDIVADTTDTISYLCGQCHGRFHNNNAGGDAGIINADAAWMRHPTDYDMANTDAGSEYKAYPGSGGSIGARPYSTAAPVASSTIGAISLATVNLLAPGTDTAIVTCISCHRAHASPYADLLRWDYINDCIIASTPNADCGCFNCHTTKDGS